MKKYLLVLMGILFFLVGCNPSSTESTIKTIDEPNEEKKLINELEENYQGNLVPSYILIEIDEKFKNIKDETLRSEFLTLADKTAKKIVTNAENKELVRSIFEVEDIEKIESPDDVNYFEYLSDETQKKVLDKMGYFLTKSYFLKEKGYEIEYLEKYKEISVGDVEGQLIQELRKDELKNGKHQLFLTLDDVGKDYEKIISGDNILLSIDDSIVIDLTDAEDFTSHKVMRIFKITDNNGVTINPKIALDGYESRVADAIKISNEVDKKESEEFIESLREAEREQEENKKVRIGMTTDEVRKRWGDPIDINRTVSQYSTREQWVYPNYKYLYFTDGILTSFQD